MNIHHYHYFNWRGHIYEKENNDPWDACPGWGCQSNAVGPQKRTISILNDMLSRFSWYFIGELKQGCFEQRVSTESETLAFKYALTLPNLCQKCLYSCRDNFVENLVKGLTTPNPPPIPRLNMQPFCSFSSYREDDENQILSNSWKLILIHSPPPPARKSQKSKKGCLQ